MPASSPPLLSVIVPIRFTLQRQDILNRLYFCKEDNLTPADIEFIVVDDGTTPSNAQKLKQRSFELGMRYLTTNADPESPFNLARARNHAARHAKGQLIMFMDVDLKPYDGFYTDIVNETKLLSMHKKINQFLMCPVIYLTEKGSNAFNKQPCALKQQFGINTMLSGDSQLIEKYSHGTSVIVLNRHYYLSTGGQNEAFEGWGYEDYEFTTRLMMKNPKFPIPESWASMIGHFMTINKYKGWKSAYRLHGDWLANKGIYLFHIAHPVDKQFHSTPYKNQRLLEKQLKRGNDAKAPLPLSYPNAGRSLLFRDNPFCYSEEIAPFLGDIIVEKEDRFTQSTELSTYLAANKISRIVFPNPYANDNLRMIYDWCRKTHFPMIVAERGALPDAIYHDHNGFLTDSQSYAREKWDKPLTENHQQQVRAYVASIRYGSQMLEQQANRQVVQAVRKTLGISESKKVAFVPFQQPNDTVIQHFSGAVGNFEDFHRVICKLSAQLGDEWCVVYKKHPVEKSLPLVEGAICADAFNTYDLIEIADALIVINSGVGLYGAMFGKPVYILGDAWYQHDGINVQVTNINNLPTLINKGYSLDMQTIERFIYYLRYQFYSFGEQHQRRIINENGHPVTATADIQYYEVRNFGLDLFFDASDPIPFSSPLFDRFRGAGKAVASKRLSPHSNNIVKRAKMKKLKQKPLLFFVDAFKNMWY